MKISNPNNNVFNENLKINIAKFEDLESIFESENQLIEKQFEESITTRYQHGVKNHCKNSMKHITETATQLFKDTETKLEVLYTNTKHDTESIFNKQIEPHKTENDDLILKAKNTCDEIIKNAMRERDETMLFLNSNFKNKIITDKTLFEHNIEKINVKYNHTKHVLKNRYKTTRAFIKSPMLECGKQVSKRVCGEYYKQ
jgi:DNA repair protein RadC